MNERLKSKETIPDPNLILNNKTLSQTLKLYRGALASYETTDDGELSKGELEAQADLTSTFSILSELRNIAQNKSDIPPSWNELNGQSDYEYKKMATLALTDGAWVIKDLVFKTPLISLSILN